MATETDVASGDGRTLHVCDTGSSGATIGLVIVWHHGTPQVGAPPEPLFSAGAEHGIRWISYDRPGYGGSSPHRDRDVASAADDVRVIADALGLDRFAVMGASGGGPHALACVAAMPDRIVAGVSAAGLAPLRASGADPSPGIPAPAVVAAAGMATADWFAGMATAGEAELRASVAGRAALESLVAVTDFDPEIFTAADHAALAGHWGWLGKVAQQGTAHGFEGLVEDDLAYVKPWGFDPAGIEAPVLLLHGDSDRVVPSSHGRWLADHCPTADLRLSADDGHISVLRHLPAALDWLDSHTRH